MKKNRLKQILRARKMTGADLHRATACKISRPDISNIMNHKRVIYPGWEELICDALNITPEQLYRNGVVDNGN